MSDMQTPDGYDFFRRLGPIQNADERYFRGRIEYWRELIEHDVYNEYWQARNPRPFLKNVKPAVMAVGGWYDAEDVFGPLHVYEAAKKQSPGSSLMIVEGPLGTRRLVERHRRQAGRGSIRKRDVESTSRRTSSTRSSCGT